MIKFVIFDFDGVFTDGKFYFNNQSMSSKCYNCKDSYSLKILKKNNIKSGVITGDNVIDLKNAKHIYPRLDKLSMGNSNKIEVLNKWIKEYNLTYENIAYIGDDIPDIPVLSVVKISGCPNDAIDSVKNVCNYVCKKNGGNGAVREFVDYIINYNKN